jgi:hypothetical protein
LHSLRVNYYICSRIYLLKIKGNFRAINYKLGKLKSTKMKTALLSVLSLVLFFTASAQMAPQTASHNVTLQLNDALTISFTTGGTGQTMTFNTVTDYNAGVEMTTAAVLNVKSNRAYNLGVTAGAQYFTLGGSPSTLTTDKLAVKEQSAATYTALSTSNQDLLSNQPLGDHSHTFDYKATPGYFQSGTYVTSVIYTATQQ